MPSQEIPTHLHVEDRVLFTLTVRQLLLISCGAVLASWLWRHAPLLPPVARAALAGLAVGAGLAGALVRPGGADLLTWLGHVLAFARAPRVVPWQRATAAAGQVPGAPAECAANHVAIRSARFSSVPASGDEHPECFAHMRSHSGGQGGRGRAQGSWAAPAAPAAGRSAAKRGAGIRRTPHAPHRPGRRRGRGAIPWWPWQDATGSARAARLLLRTRSAARALSSVWQAQRARRARGEDSATARAQPCSPRGVWPAPAGGTALQDLGLVPLAIADGVVTLRGPRHCAVLEVSALSPLFLSEGALAALATAYHTFLAGLRFPLQILVQTRSDALAPYLDRLRAAAERQSDPALAWLDRVHLAHAERVAAHYQPVERHFYVVVPAPEEAPHLSHPAALARPWPRPPAPAGGTSPAARAAGALEERCATVARALGAAGLRAERLDTTALARLWYGALCPATARLQPLTTDALADAGMPVGVLLSPTTDLPTSRTAARASADEIEDVDEAKGGDDGSPSLDRA